MCKRTYTFIWIVFILPTFVLAQDFISRTEFRNGFRKAFHTRSCKELEKYHSYLLSKHINFPDGAPVVNEFYSSLRMTCTADSQLCKDLFIDARDTCAPSNPFTTFMMLEHNDTANRARGNSWAKNISSEKMGQYRQFKQKVLNESQYLSNEQPIDAAAYSVILGVLSALGAPESEIDPLLEQAIRLYPLYLNFYTNRANYLLPRWGGSFPKLLNFAERSEELSRHQLGTGAYAVIASSIAKLFNEKVFTEVGFKKQKTWQGFRDLIDLYPDAKFLQHRFAYMTYNARDRTVAREAFHLLGDQYDSSYERIWSGQRNFEHIYQWAFTQPSARDQKVDLLFSAISRNSVAEVSPLVQELGLETTNPTGVTMMEEAAMENSLNVAKKLVEMGYKLSVRSALVHEGKPLHYAVHNGYHDFAKFLLDNGVSPNAYGFSLKPALVLALEKGHEDIIQLLLDNPETSLLSNSHKWGNLLWVAYKVGNRKAFQYFLENKGPSILTPIKPIGSDLPTFLAITGDLPTLQTVIQENASLYYVHQMSRIKQLKESAENANQTQIVTYLQGLLDQAEKDKQDKFKAMQDKLKKRQLEREQRLAKSRREV